MYIQGRMQTYSTSPAPIVPATGLPSNITPDINEPATSVSAKNTKVKRKGLFHVHRLLPMKL